MASNQKKSSLVEFLTRHKIDIASITETQLKNNKLSKLLVSTSNIRMVYKMET